MNESLRKLQIALRAQLVLGRAQGRQLARTALLIAVGLVFFVAAIAILDLAAFTALAESLGAVEGGLIVGAGNLLIGLALFRSAGAEPKASEEVRLAQELSDLSLDSLGKDIDLVRDELREFSGDVRRIRHAIALVTTAVGAPVQLLLKVLRESLGDEADGRDEDTPAHN